MAHIVHQTEDTLIVHQAADDNTCLQLTILNHDTASQVAALVLHSDEKRRRLKISGDSQASWHRSCNQPLRSCQAGRVD